MNNNDVVHTDIVEDVMKAANIPFMHRNSKSATCLNYRLNKSMRCNNCSRFYEKIIEKPKKKRGKGRDSICEQPWRSCNEESRVEV